MPLLLYLPSKAFVFSARKYPFEDFRKVKYFGTGVVSAEAHPYRAVTWRTEPSVGKRGAVQSGSDTYSVGVETLGQLLGRNIFDGKKKYTAIAFGVHRNLRKTRDKLAHNGAKH